MNISLPDSLKTFVDEQVAAGGYSSSSEYVRELIRKEKDREHLRALVLEGMASPVEGVFDKEYFDGLRKRIKEGRRARQSKKA